ncbi:glycosyltransferase family protein [Streptomonospora nanhaiensis]|uniref:glycosyl transferase family 2 n=1 Tax=Streptomonospora nanhaiensis TaxID=1323731 RepID=UPI001C386085|nr:glycosyl transferase family 2 [Streptomonospora nanhaiensis]MBV2364409.1 glycosyl transferase family 2 [Streptomonospora nanhaiensis]
MFIDQYRVSWADGVSFRGRVERLPLRVFRNDWRSLCPPRVGSWTPRLTVSVVVCGAEPGPLSATLGALAAQTYPAALLEVVVVHDHLRPAPPGPLGPGRRAAAVPALGDGGPAPQGRLRAYGAHTTGGDLLCWLDSGARPDPVFVESHARWHHLHAECATLARTGAVRAAPLGGHPPRAGSALMLRRSLYEAVGGLDPDSGPDCERDLCARLWHAGAVLVPERALAGQAAGARGAEPDPRTPAAPSGAQRVEAVVEAGGVPAPLVRACVDRLLAQTGCDLAVTLVGAWDRADDPGPPSGAGLRAVRDHYRGHPRVSFSTVVPRTAFPAPWLLQVPVHWGLAPGALSRLIARAERARAGVLEAVPVRAPARGCGVRLWRTRAHTRALRVRVRGEDPADVVAEVYGRYRLQAGESVLVDLLGPPAPQAPRPPAPRPEPDPGGRPSRLARLYAALRARRC